MDRVPNIIIYVHIITTTPSEKVTYMFYSLIQFHALNSILALFMGTYPLFSFDLALLYTA